MNNFELDKNAYFQGKYLNNAIFEFGNSELIRAYQAYSEIQQKSKNSAPSNLTEFLQGAAQQISQYQFDKSKRENIFHLLQKNILEQINRGDLIPCGFKEPRNIQDNPIKIPADLFSTGEINWEKSELKSKTMEFSGIRLLKDLNPITDLKAKKIEVIDIKEEKNNEKSRKLNFSDISPEQLLTEKQAAEYLNCSAKTLQGYRVKGGGPEYSKLNPKMVRYKFADLQKWSEERKKSNTSQY